jgi:glycosyltransferase involved in cell wall biosynthesis
LSPTSSALDGWVHTTMPRVSVVVPAYNAELFIAEAIESVLAQTFVDFELIVVDDGSTDCTKAAISSFTDERLRYLWQENGERSAARNAGIRSAHGEFVAFLDADDAWLPDKLARQVALLDADSEIGLVYCGAWKLRDGVIVGQQKAAHRGNVVRTLLSVDNVIAGSASAAMIRRDVLEEVGGFDERLVIFEDWDLWLRIARRSQVDFVAENLVNVRLHEGNTQTRLALMKSGVQNFFDRLLADPSWADEVRPVARRVRALEMFLIGRICCNAGEMSEARKYLLRSVSYDPFRLSTWIYLGASFGGRPLLEWIRACRSAIQRLVWRRIARGERSM